MTKKRLYQVTVGEITIVKAVHDEPVISLAPTPPVVRNIDEDEEILFHSAV